MLNNVAASFTVLAIGPAVSSVSANGIMPDLLTIPSDGRNPTTDCCAAGATIDPVVSVPIASGAKSAATTVADPELDPEVSNVTGPYGFKFCPFSRYIRWAL